MSATYQSEPFDDTDDFGLDQFTDTYYQVDFFAGYKLPIDSDIGSFSLYFEATDITDSGTKGTDVQTTGRGSRLYDEASFNGREFRLGIRASF